MKKILLALAFVVAACSTDDYYEPLQLDIIPEQLMIAEPVGIKLSSNFANKAVDMNVKLDQEGNYYIKIKNNYGRVVAKEKVNGKIGDNIFKVYTSTLPKSSYRIELYLEDNKIGVTQINLIK